jgi:lysophospholipase L1-like esterase
MQNERGYCWGPTGIFFYCGDFLVINFKSLAFVTLCALASPALIWAADDQPTRVACVGDSITHGSGTQHPATESYPAQLGKLLGDKFAVQNFGVGGATLLNHGDKPYQKQGLCKSALDSKPDVVVIMLGTNDSKPQNWKFKDEFVADYKNLVEQFAKLPTHPQIFVCLPPPVPGNGNYGINEAGVTAEIPMIKEIAQDEHAKVIDNHTPLEGKSELLPDRVHPNVKGAAILAETVQAAVTSK